MIRYLKYLVFPPHCVFCGCYTLDSYGPCENCVSQLPLLTETCCERCGLPKANCDCAGKRLSYSGVSAVMKYQDLAIRAVAEFKRKPTGPAAEIISELMAVSAKAKLDLSGIDFVTAVPMHKIRRKRTGANHSELLAKNFAQKLGIEYRELLVKKHNVKEQKKLSYFERQGNVLGAFECGADLSGKTVIVVDDIKTTGATLTECAKTLLLAGAEDVKAAVFAITVKEKP